MSLGLARRKSTRELLRAVDPDLADRRDQWEREFRVLLAVTIVCAACGLVGVILTLIAR